MENKVESREERIALFRKGADWLEKHPDLPCPSNLWVCRPDQFLVVRMDIPIEPERIDYWKATQAARDKYEKVEGLRGEALQIAIDKAHNEANNELYRKETARILRLIGGKMTKDYTNYSVNIDARPEPGIWVRVIANRSSVCEEVEVEKTVVTKVKEWKCDSIFKDADLDGIEDITKKNE